MVVEAAVGAWAGSLALIADAGHMLGDSAALTLALVAQYIAGQARTRAKTFGFRRAEVLAAFANGIALALVAVWIFVEAWERWHNPVVPKGAAMMVVAAVGLAVNLIAAWILHAGESHNVNTRAALAHVISDAIGSMGALLAGALVLWADWAWADPVISVAIACLVLASGARLLHSTTQVLMEGTPHGLDVHAVEAEIGHVPGVAAVHDLHVWCISDGFPIVTVHVVLSQGSHGTEVARAVSDRLKERFGVTHSTVQPEAPEQPLVQLQRRPTGG